MFCPQCRNELPDDAKYCIKCGYDFAKIKTPPEKKRYQDSLDVSGTLINQEIEVESFKVAFLFANRYEILSEGLKGGMGVVYKCKDTMLNKIKALKVIHPRLLNSKQAVSRFRQEVAISQELQHENIVRVYDLDEWEGKEFFTMEWVEGETLREIITKRKKENRPFSIEEAYKIISQVSEALEHAHKYTIHRDIKPENILVTSGKDLKVKLSDFGIAKMLSTSQFTSTSVQMGTPYYMAPEQKVDAAHVDKRADIYALGVVLFELLTLENTIGLEMPSEIKEDIPRQIDNVVKKALSTKPEQRYDDAKELSDALQKCLIEERQRAEEEISKEEEQREKEEKQRKREEEERLKKEEERKRKEEKEGEKEEAERKHREDERKSREEEKRRLEAEEAERSRKSFQKKIISVIAIAGIFIIGLIIYQYQGKEKIPEGEEGQVTQIPTPEKQPETQIPVTHAPVPPQVSTPVPTPQAPGIEFVFVKGGCYQMGDTFGDGDSNEKPVHEVCIDDFYMGRYEVTQGQWREIMGNNPSHFKNCGNNCPVENVSWNDVQGFIQELNQRTGKKYRLPTEAEWEYACRSGGKGEKYAGSNNIDSIAWYYSNSGNKTHPVGTKSPNGLGLHDMSGNVWEWVQDWYNSDAYKMHSHNNPIYESGGADRVERGGFDLRFVRCAGRGHSAPDYRGYGLGFRLLSPVKRETEAFHRANPMK